jgi:hypothetical protein
MQRIIFMIIIGIIWIRPIDSTPEKEKKNIRVQVEKYFSVWSEGKMDEYETLFHPSAIIFYRYKNSNQFRTDSVPDFIAGQREAQKNSTELLTEIPLDIQILFQGKDTAQVSVYWKLFSKNRNTLGYDHFTWVKINGEWKILNLYFYSK